MKTHAVQTINVIGAYRSICRHRASIDVLRHC